MSSIAEVFGTSSPVMLAPMAGLTDSVFRKIALDYGADLVVSEMVASQEVVQARPLARGRAQPGDNTAQTAIQLAGRDPYWMAEAAKYCEGSGASIIDINMGCPAKKVTSGRSGSALMREPDLALELIEAVVGAVSIPVTLKMRLGWDDAHLNAPEIARQAEDAGVAMITVHGRTRCQFYKGHADWRAIRQTVDAVSVPVIANGDIVSSDAARQALEHSGAIGVMVGRSAVGAPWLLGQIGRDLRGQPQMRMPSKTQILSLALRHFRGALHLYGTGLGVKSFRKHLSAYLSHLSDGAAIRRGIITETDPSKIETRLLRAMMEDARESRAA